MNAKFSLFLIAFIVFLQGTQAQKGINSIYSAYGIGDYRMRDQNAFLGMGNAGVAMPSQTNLNEINPASFGWLPKNKFIFELGLGGLSTKYTSDKVDLSAGNFTISRVAMGFQLVKPLWTVFGLRRLSTVDYLTTNSHDVAGTTSTYTSTIEGNGGLYQVYMSNSVRLLKHLSLGLTGGFIFGSVNTTETVGTDAATQLIEDNNKFYDHGTLNAGLQYELKVGKNAFMFGAFYEPQVALKVLEENSLQNSSAVVLVKRDDKESRFAFPKKYGVGVTWKRNDFTVTADAIVHNWAATGYKGTDFTTRDAQSFSVGIRHQPMKQGVFGISQGIGLYAGATLENSYLVIDNYALQTKAVTLGASFPSKNTLNAYTIGLKVGTRGQAVYPLVKENFLEFNFTFSFGGYFLKGPRYD